MFATPETKALMEKIRETIEVNKTTITLYKVSQLTKRKGPELFFAEYSPRIEGHFLKWRMHQRFVTSRQGRVMPRYVDEWTWVKDCGLRITPEEAWETFIDKKMKDANLSLADVTRNKTEAIRAEKCLKRLKEKQAEKKEQEE
jgi:hypothetical protein